MDLHYCIHCNKVFLCNKIDDLCICLSETIILHGILFCDLYFCSSKCYIEFINKLEPYKDEDKLRLLELLYNAYKNIK